MNIELCVGPMFSGKTSFLLKNMEKAKLLNPGLKTLYIMHSYDIKRKILSHSPIFEKYKDDIEIVYTTSLTKTPMGYCAPILENEIQYACVCIDEAQFYDDLLEFIKKHNNNPNVKNIFISGLDSNSNMEKFAGSQIPDILNYCDSIKKKKAICSECGKNAPFTKLKVNEKLPKNNILIGGGEMYKPVCRKCHLDNKI